MFNGNPPSFRLRGICLGVSSAAKAAGFLEKFGFVIMGPSRVGSCQGRDLLGPDGFSQFRLFTKLPGANSSGPESLITLETDKLDFLVREYFPSFSQDGVVIGPVATDEVGNKSVLLTTTCGLSLSIIQPVRSPFLFPGSAVTG
jgi:hypothetical protein